MGAVLSRSGRQPVAMSRTKSESTVHRKKSSNDDTHTEGGAAGGRAGLLQSKSHGVRLISPSKRDHAGTGSKRAFGGQRRKSASWDVEEGTPPYPRSDEWKGSSLDGLEASYDEDSSARGKDFEDDMRHAMAGEAAAIMLSGLGSRRASTAQQARDRKWSTDTSERNLRRDDDSYGKREVHTERPTPRAGERSSSSEPRSYSARAADGHRHEGMGAFPQRERGERTKPTVGLRDGERRRLEKEKERRREERGDFAKSRSAGEPGTAHSDIDSHGISRSQSAESSTSASSIGSRTGVERTHSGFGLRERRRGETAQGLPPVTTGLVDPNSVIAGAGRNSASPGAGARASQPGSAKTSGQQQQQWGGKRSGSETPRERRSNTRPEVNVQDLVSVGGAISSAENFSGEDDETSALEVPLSSLGSIENGEIRQIGIVQRWQRGNLLGSGSYGKVYLGMNLDSGELFVVKQVVFTDQQAILGCPNQEDVAQLEQEIALLATLAHDNIVKYLGTERNNLTNELSIFLEHMPGGSVADLVARFGGLDELVIRKYTREALEGLLYLHRRGIIHRDIKGQNILVDNRGVCKLADFGASRYLKETSKTTNFSFKGTPVFMSPEVIMEQRYSRKSDVWSLGCTVIQMATGNPPYSHFSNHIAALFHITNNNEPPPIPEQLSDEAKTFLLQCFVRDTSQRASVEDLLRRPFISSGKHLASASAGSPTFGASHGLAGASSSGQSSDGLARTPGFATSERPAPQVEQDDDRAWEKWKERQWKEGAKTAVRLRKGDPNRSGSHATAAEIERLLKAGEKKPQHSSYSFDQTGPGMLEMLQHPRVAASTGTSPLDSMVGASNEEDKEKQEEEEFPLPPGALMRREPKNEGPHVEVQR